MRPTDRATARTMLGRHHAGAGSVLRALAAPRRWLLAGLLASLASGTAGCGLCGDVECGACPSALTLRVTDQQSGAAVADLTATGAEALCDQPAGADYTSCDVQLGAGTFEFVLSAPGYADETVAVTINPDSGESCCSCGYNSKILDLTMTPAP